ncbi:uncharacterized protein LOC118735053 [Rhagoletis pomonella]|uniref:uncharacterized protein LOC118735053 n=1 Tax=Rhagoletis pomonella TaxID=28610 RepID=UPI001781D8D8|nr:uncharacterized protein LOC118735053 [Rhagoletis pomonella]
MYSVKLVLYLLLDLICSGCAFRPLVIMHGILSGAEKMVFLVQEIEKIEDIMAARKACPLAPTADTDNCLQCRLCHRYHALRTCPAFKAMKPPQRLGVARAQGYCVNCLALTHTTGECDSPGSCKTCGLAHHVAANTHRARGQGNRVQEEETGHKGPKERQAARTAEEKGAEEGAEEPAQPCAATAAQEDRPTDDRAHSPRPTNGQFPGPHHPPRPWQHDPRPERAAGDAQQRIPAGPPLKLNTW